MSISKGVKVMAVSAIAALVVVGGLGLVVANNLGEALHSSNMKAIPSIQLLYQLKTNQQLVALSLYRHIGSTQKEEMAELERTIATASKGMTESLASYDKYLRTEKGANCSTPKKRRRPTISACCPRSLKSREPTTRLALMS